MSLLHDLIGTRQQAPAKPATSVAAPIVERQAAPTAVDVPVEDDLIPNHDKAHPNYNHHKALADVLKRTNPRVYAKMLNWD